MSARSCINVGELSGEVTKMRLRTMDEGQSCDDQQVLYFKAAGGFPLRIAPSPGMGRGVFTSSRIPNGQFLGIYEGERVDDDELEHRGIGSYVFDLGNGWGSIDAEDVSVSNWTRYINHSKSKQNVRAHVCCGSDYVMVLLHDDEGSWEDLELDGLRVELWSTRVLMPGDELLLNYGPAYVASMEYVVDG